MAVDRSYRFGTWSVISSLAAVAAVMWYWPFALVAIALIILRGSALLGIALALFFDLFWGMPPVSSSVHILIVPFAFFALLCVAAKYLAKKFLYSSSARF